MVILSKNTSLLNKIFSSRLKTRSKELGYKTESELCDYLSDRYPDNISTAAVHSWWSNSAIPGNENLIRLCDALQCDIDYLYGRIDASTHDIFPLSKGHRLIAPLGISLVMGILESLPTYVSQYFSMTSCGSSPSSLAML